MNSFTPEQRALLRRTLCKDLSGEDFELFLMVAQASGLDPFRRQIYALTRRAYNKETKQYENRMSIQTSIDGYRSIAARSGLHAGTSDAAYGPELPGGYPAWARVSVKKLLPNGAVAAFDATARWKEYVQTDGGGSPTRQWATMPYLMLAKCAESLALRKAFPDELAGIYTAEEMAQAGSELHEAPPVLPPAQPEEERRVDQTTGEVLDETPTPEGRDTEEAPAAPTPPPQAASADKATSKQLGLISSEWTRLFGNMKLAPNQAKAQAHMQTHTGCSLRNDLTKRQASAYIDQLKATVGQEDPEVFESALAERDRDLEEIPF